MEKRITGRQIIVIITVISASVLEIIDATIVNIAIPDLMGNLGATITEVGWVITSYAAANIVMIALAAWMGSKLGRRNYFVLSIAVFTIGSLLCGLSENIWSLVFFRFIQGMGGGALIATAQAIIVETFPKERLNFANSLFGMGIVFGPAIGPLLGGYILNEISWHWIFYINIPFGIAATILSWLFIPEPKEKEAIGKMDWFGLILLIAGFGSLLTVLENGEEAGWWHATYIKILTLVAILGTLFFVLRQSKASKPIVNLQVVKNVYFSLGIIINFIVSTGMAAMFLILPLFAQNLLGMTPLQTGLIILPGVIVIIIAMPFIGRLPQKWWQLLLYMFIGFVLVITYNLWMVHFSPDSSRESFFLPVVLRGLGISVLFIPLATISLVDLKGKQIPEGTGVYNMVRKIGNSLGVALTTNFIAHRIDFHENILSGSITNSDIGTQHFKEQLIYYLKYSGIDLSSIPAIVQLELSNNLTRQAFLLGYLDTFMLTAVFFAICIPFLFIFFIVRKFRKEVPS
ncbi:MAG: DHA2 family efflux MFS transporter permease subunit [Bacteroidales bacterium]